MRVADQGALLNLLNRIMKYFANYEADAVIREDDNGQRFIKYIDSLDEGGPMPRDHEETWGIPTFGIFNELKPITKQEYDGFGYTWDWSPTTGEKRKLRW